MSLPFFGLDIGTANLKGVWLEKTKNGYKLKSYFKSQTPTKGMSSISPIDEDQMSQAISKSVQEAKIATRQANLSLPDSQVYTKVIETPNLTDKELESSINWIAEQYIPVQLSTVMLDWQVLQKDIKTQTGLKMQVLLAGAPIALLQKYKKIVEFAGCSVGEVETEMLATVRAVMGNDTTSTFLVISIGNLSTSIAIVQHGILSFIYTVPVGSNAINRAIASNFGLTLDQADQYKKAYGIKDQAVGGKIRLAIDPILMSLSEEVKKGVAFYRERQVGNGGITQIILSGGSAKMPGMDLYFVNALGVETVIANPWKILAVEGVPDEIASEGPEFAISLGLAVKNNE